MIFLAKLADVLARKPMRGVLELSHMLNDFSTQ
jgi:hypothetical protein